MATSPIETVVVPRTRDLGGFEVRRALPSQGRRMVGPFVFFDEMGPALFGAGQGLDVRPHPHIGLATVTYLFAGELLHRDSLGTVQVIEPGAVNWMTAGRGIAHSERTPPAARAGGGRLSGIQVWVALPRAREEDPPAFVHTPAAALPAIDVDGVHLRVILGAAHGARSPVQVHSETLYLDARLDPGARLEIAADQEERAAYVVDGAVAEGEASFAAGRLVVFRPGSPAVLRAIAPSRLVVLGGATLDGPRHVWWNFVSSSQERIRQAADDWAAERFAPVPGETERIPLPDPPRVVAYP
jgi:redox-sensitive bicupin YhaK (pirin superfamily)